MRHVVNWAKVKVVNWEETEEHVTEDPISKYNLLVTRERTVCHHERCNRDCMRPHPGEKFEVELKKYATTVEVVPDSQTFRFGPGAVKKSSRAIIYPVAVGQTVFLLRARLGSVVDVAEKTIEFQTIPERQGPS